jgi:hypothetical protein
MPPWESRHTVLCWLYRENPDAMKLSWRRTDRNPRTVPEGETGMESPTGTHAMRPASHGPRAVWAPGGRAMAGVRCDGNRRANRVNLVGNRRVVHRKDGYAHIQNYADEVRSSDRRNGSSGTHSPECRIAPARWRSLGDRDLERTGRSDPRRKCRRLARVGRQ